MKYLLIFILILCAMSCRSKIEKMQHICYLKAMRYSDSADAADQRGNKVLYKLYVDSFKIYYGKFMDLELEK